MDQRPRFYLPIVFWLGCVLLAFGLVTRHGSAIVGGALVMAWGLLLGLVAHWAQRARPPQAAASRSGGGGAAPPSGGAAG